MANVNSGIKPAPITVIVQDTVQISDAAQDPTTPPVFNPATQPAASPSPVAPAAEPAKPATVVPGVKDELAKLRTMLSQPGPPPFSCTTGGTDDP